MVVRPQATTPNNTFEKVTLNYQLTESVPKEAGFADWIAQLFAH